MNTLFDLSPRSYRLERSGFASDARNLCGDFEAIALDMKEALGKEAMEHGESSDKRARQEQGRH
ncbi:MAG: hypothetical protein LBI92_01045 [Azoarcus sp.]|nr:hypothetical protein [Azoarcus sp.]